MHSEDDPEILAQYRDKIHPEDPALADIDVGTQTIVKAMGLFGGDVRSLNTLKWIGTTSGDAIAAATKADDELVKGIIFTRWTVPTPRGPPWSLDILEHYWPELTSKWDRWWESVETLSC